MIDLDAFKKSDLQDFMAILNQLEIAGINDIRFARSKIQRYLDGVLIASRADKIKNRLKVPRQLRPKLCPSCKKMTLHYKEKSIEGYPVNTCKCGYTQMAVE